MPEKTGDRPRKKTKRVREIPSPYQKNCVSMSPSQFVKFILDIDTTDWEIVSIDGGVEKDVKVSHVTLDFIGIPGKCPECGIPLAIHDRRERVWRHANLDNTVCYLHAKVPRCQCPKCGKLAQVDLPWADPNVSYTKRFMEVAIEHMSQMSLLAASRVLMTTWRVLDGIVEVAVRKHLDTMDLSKLRRIRVDETSAKKNHRYITVITDVDTDDIVFITKGRDNTVMREFRDWVLAHNGDPSKIEMIATDFGSSFMLGATLFFPNADAVLDPFHLVQIANRALDKDRNPARSTVSV